MKNFQCLQSNRDRREHGESTKFKVFGGNQDMGGLWWLHLLHWGTLILILSIYLHFSRRRRETELGGLQPVSLCEGLSHSSLYQEAQNVLVSIKSVSSWMDCFTRLVRVSAGRSIPLRYAWLRNAAQFWQNIPQTFHKLTPLIVMLIYSRVLHFATDFSKVTNTHMSPTINFMAPFTSLYIYLSINLHGWFHC